MIMWQHYAIEGWFIDEYIKKVYFHYQIFTLFYLYSKKVLLLLSIHITYNELYVKLLHFIMQGLMHEWNTTHCAN